MGRSQWSKAAETSHKAVGQAEILNFSLPMQPYQERNCFDVWHCLSGRSENNRNFTDRGTAALCSQGWRSALLARLGAVEMNELEFPNHDCNWYRLWYVSVRGSQTLLRL
uniref:Uncharacterized protein n=1 Tax=Coccidioides posadasii RMSCC 3488 TaxID=454284 RepID=A0A0J6FJA9_COCPO|nr:hypothetical protein CPAG_06705 [Coccidioides posadasii RMSCC 3488]